MCVSSLLFLCMCMCVSVCVRGSVSCVCAWECFGVCAVWLALKAAGMFMDTDKQQDTQKKVSVREISCLFEQRACTQACTCVKGLSGRGSKQMEARLSEERSKVTFKRAKQKSHFRRLSGVISCFSIREAFRTLW